MLNYLSYFLFWGSLGLAILAIALILFVPKHRKQLLKIQTTTATLEERYAKELAAGTAVIIPKDPTALKKLIFLMICGGVLIIIFQRFKTYTSSLQQSCASVDGWNGLIVFLGGVFSVGGILCLSIMLYTYKNYKEIIEDGYAPSRKNKEIHDRISFKLTKWLKLKEQLRLTILVSTCIFYISSPILLLQILMNTPTHKITSIYEFNDRLQKSCLDDLKEKKSLK